MAAPPETSQGLRLPVVVKANIGGSGAGIVRFDSTRRLFEGRRAPHADIDQIGGGGRLSPNVVSNWWQDEAERYGVVFEKLDRRSDRTSERLDAVAAFGQAGVDLLLLQCSPQLEEME